MKVKEMIEELEDLIVTTDRHAPGHAYALFEKVLDALNMDYWNPGEPEARCLSCNANWPLPGVYGEDAYTSDEAEEGIELDSDVYWTRVWATRALDLLDPQYAVEPCCEDNRKLLEQLGIL